MGRYFAVFGHPVAHSLSPRIHAAFARQSGIDLRYEPIDATLEGFFVALQAFYLIWKWRRDYLREIERKANGRPVPETGLGKLETDE